MQKTFQIYTLVLGLFLTIAVFTSYSKEEEKKESHIESTLSKSIPQIVKSADLNRSFDLAGELVPMHNFDARERLDRELTVNTYWHSSTLLNIKNTYKYFPVIERILAENGVPDDFKYLAVAESNLRNATSPAGAKGIWQFMKPVAQGYGLEVNNEVDERYHIEKVTEAACKYILEHKKQFGSWTLTAASYNMGGPRLKREMKVQRAQSYYDLNLNQETGRYVFRIIAIKEVMKNPQNFGFFLDKEDAYAPLSDYSIVEVNSSVENWGDFANKYGISYRLLKVYNPWLIASRLTNRARKTYKIKIPMRKI